MPQLFGFRSPHISAKMRETFALIDDMVEFDDKSHNPPMKEQISPDDIRIAIQTLETAIEQLKSTSPILSLQDSDSMLQSAPSRKQYITNVIVQYLFNFTLVWQILNVVAADTSRLGVSVLLFLQSFHLLGVLFITFLMLRRVRQVSFSLAFLIQSYLSTLALFAGIYFLIFKLDDSSFAGVIQGDASSFHPFFEYVRILYFSATTMTTVGYGDISPHSWYACVLVIGEQLVSFVFTTVLFGMGMVHFSSKMLKNKN